MHEREEEIEELLKEIDTLSREICDLTLDLEDCRERERRRND